MIHQKIETNQKITQENNPDPETIRDMERIEEVGMENKIMNIGVEQEAIIEAKEEANHNSEETNQIYEKKIGKDTISVQTKGSIDQKILQIGIYLTLQVILGLKT